MSTPELTVEEALQKLKERGANMTPEDRWQQRISFITGMLSGDDPAATRKYVEEELNKRREAGSDTL